MALVSQGILSLHPPRTALGLPSSLCLCGGREDQRGLTQPLPAPAKLSQRPALSGSQHRSWGCTVVDGDTGVAGGQLWSELLSLLPETEHCPLPLGRTARARSSLLLLPAAACGHPLSHPPGPWGCFPGDRGTDPLSLGVLGRGFPPWPVHTDPTRAIFTSVLAPGTGAPRPFLVLGLGSASLQTWGRVENGRDLRKTGITLGRRKGEQMWGTQPRESATQVCTRCPEVPGEALSPASSHHPLPVPTHSPKKMGRKDTREHSLQIKRKGLPRAECSRNPWSWPEAPPGTKATSMVSAGRWPLELPSDSSRWGSIRSRGPGTSWGQSMK